MHRIFACMLCLHVLSIALVYRLSAQPTHIDKVLAEIEQNNVQLQAFKSYVEGRTDELMASNGLPQLQLLGYYLPLGELTTGDYYEFEIAQSFDFPTVYSARRQLISLQQQQLMTEYDQKRQEVLLPARKYCLSLIYWNKKARIEAKRVEQARMLYEQSEERFAQDQIGVLDLNKAKVGWLQKKFAFDKIVNERRAVEIMLENLNGGIPIEFEADSYSAITSLTNLDSLWEQRQLMDPALRLLTQQQAVASQSVKLAKKKNLPGLTAGYNYQGFMGEIFSGVMAGISIPLWKGGAKVRAATSISEYQRNLGVAELQQAKARLEEQFNRFRLLRASYLDYQHTLDNLGSEELLRKAYDLGELSYLQYYEELQFYVRAYDDMLLMERQLHELYAELNKHQL